MLKGDKGSDTGSNTTSCYKIYDKVETMYESLMKQVISIQDKIERKQGSSKVTMAQIMKQFKLFKNLVAKIRSTAEDTGSLDDLAMHKQADEKLMMLKRQLSVIDEEDNDYKHSDRYRDQERDTTGSCIGGSHLNFYPDDEEAQELILDEDRLTLRSAHGKKCKDDSPANSFESYDDFDKYQKVRNKRNAKGKFLNIYFSSDTVCLRYMMLIIVFLITLLFVYVLWMIRTFHHGGKAK